MSLVQRVAKYISHLRKGTLLDAKSLERFCDRKAANKVLSRLFVKGLIKRAAKGVYFKSTGEVLFGLEITPPSMDVVNFILRNDRRYDTRGIYGPLALNLLKISTQVSFRKAYYVAGPSRTVKVYNSEVYFFHVPSWRLVHADTPVDMAISALFFIKKEEVTTDLLGVIAQTLSKEDMSILLQTMQTRLSRWLGNVAKQYEEDYAK